MELTLPCKIQYLNDLDPFDHRSTVPEPTRPPTHVFLTNVPLGYQLANVIRLLQAPHKLEDCALQLCKFAAGQSEFLSYLDLEQTLDEQQEELEGFTSNKRNLIILRTQLSVRVQCCLEKLSGASAKELKKYLFALKQIFQDDKDLVHEFVDSEGLDCLIKISYLAESNSIYYVLKALGQLMLYVDGMNGVMRHNKTLQWLYSFINSQPRLVVKMALKLLLVFIDYNDSNWQLLTQAISVADSTTGSKPWGNFMKLMHDEGLVDAEVMTYALTLVNKTLSAVPDQDTFYDITDSLEEQGIEGIMKKYRESKSEDKELLEQFSAYDSLVSLEDGDVSPQAVASGFRKFSKGRNANDTKRQRRRSADVSNLNSADANKFGQRESTFSSQRLLTNGFHSEDSTKSSPKILVGEHDAPPGSETEISITESRLTKAAEDGNEVQNNEEEEDDDEVLIKSPEDKTSHCVNATLPERQSSTNRQSMNRRQRRQRQQSQIQEMINLTSASQDGNKQETRVGNAPANLEPSDTSERSAVTSLNNNKTSADLPTDPGSGERSEEVNSNSKEKFSISNIPGASLFLNAVEEEALRGNDWRPGLSAMGRHASLDEAKSPVTVGTDFASKVCAAKSQLKSTKMSLKKHDSGPPGTSTVNKLCDVASKPFTNWSANKLPTNKAAADARQDAIQWSAMEKECSRLPLRIKDSDFTDLTELDDQDYLGDRFQSKNSQFVGSSGSSVDLIPTQPCPPPPPPPPPPLLLNNQKFGSKDGTIPPPPPPLSGVPVPPPLPASFGTLKSDTLQKKKTKLHWREANSKFSMPNGKTATTIWEELKREVGDVKIDKVKFEALFEIRTQEIKTKEKMESSKKELSILDQKRSNAINIGMVHLPKATAIKTAILSMDNSVLSREDIEKILVGMMPTEEEKNKIIEVQRSNNLGDLQLGTAEQFLLTMGSISELESRLRLWVFKLDYDTVESEICDPLFDLKKGIEELKRSRTFKFILSTLLSVGNFLNNSQVAGFTVDYLMRVIEVKDNVYRHTLLHHLVNIVLDTFPDSTDLYSEIGSITRCAKIDWDDLKEKLQKLEADCDSSMEHLRSIIKHDSLFQAKHRMHETLQGITKRIVLVKIVYRRVINRFRKFLLWLGYSAEEGRTVTVGQLCRAVSEFALEYRTTREKVLNVRLKKANMKERKKTRGVMIVQTEKFAMKAKKLPTLGEDADSNELESILQNGSRLNPTKNRARRSLDPKAFQRSLSSSKSSLSEADAVSLGKVDSETSSIKDGETKEPERTAVTPTPSDGGEDDLLEAVLRSVTTTTEPKTRERRRARNVERKSLRRTLKNGLSFEETVAIGKFG